MLEVEVPHLAADLAQVVESRFRQADLDGARVIETGLDGELNVKPLSQPICSRVRRAHMARRRPNSAVEQPLACDVRKRSRSIARPWPTAAPPTDETFDLCVRLLALVTELLGISYEEGSVWLLVIVGPLPFVALATIVLFQRHEIWHLRAKSEAK